MYATSDGDSGKERGMWTRVYVAKAMYALPTVPTSPVSRPTRCSLVFDRTRLRSDGQLFRTRGLL